MNDKKKNKNEINDTSALAGNLESENVNLPDANFSGEGESNSDSGDHLITALKSELERLKIENEDHRDKYLRSLAEMENFKKRSLKEKSDLLKYQGEKVLFDMLEIVDNLELAIKHSTADTSKVKEGIELIYKRLLDILNKWEVKAESSLGMHFDPSKHSAISKIQQEGVEQGSVVSELKKAYYFKDKLLRFAEVVVAESSPSLAGTEEKQVS